MRTVDLYGHGVQSEWCGESPLTLADEVALVEPILHEGGRVHLVGHSYGAAVALKAAQLHPYAVRSLVVYEPVMFRWLFDEDPNSDMARGVIALSTGMRKLLNAGDELGAAAAVPDLLVRRRHLEFNARRAPAGSSRADACCAGAFRRALGRNADRGGPASTRFPHAVPDGLVHRGEHASHR